MPHDAPIADTLDHYVSGSVWQVPTTVRVDDVGPEGVQMLVWSGEPPYRDVRPGIGLFEDFLKLERAKDPDDLIKVMKEKFPSSDLLLAIERGARANAKH